MLRIFISHSTDKSDALGNAYVRALAAGLESVIRDGRPIFEVFLDRNALQGGDDWKQKIVNHLLYCHAAIVVLSERALRSDFVKFEFSNLLARRSRERDPVTGQPTFAMIPLLPWTGGTGTRQALQDQLMQALDQGFWKAIGALELNFVAPSTVDEALPQLEATLTALTLPGDSQLDPLAREVAKYLRKVPRTSLEGLAAEVNLRLPPAGFDAEQAAAHLAGQLLLLAPADIYNILVSLNADLKDEDKSDLFQLLAPSWVSPEAALALRPMLAKSPSRLCPIVNGTLADFTPEMYVRRAMGRVRRFAGIFHTMHEPTAVDDLAELRLLVARLFVDTGEQAADYFVKVKRAIEAKTQLNRPVVVAVPVSSPESLRTLMTLSQQEEFKPLVFFALTGQESFAFDDPVAVPLAPPLFESQETVLKDLYAQIEAEAF